MYFLKIKGTNHITKKIKGLIKLYFINKFESVTYVTCVSYFSPLYFNSTIPKKINLGSKGLNYTKKKFKNQTKSFEKITDPIHIDL